MPIYKKYRHLRRVAINVYVALQARRQYRNPTRNVRIIGITGTDGKTTTSTMLAGILQASGRKVGVITTVSALINGRSIDTGFHVSTPGPAQMYELLAMMQEEGVDDVIIEATSHGLDQRRLFGIPFAVGIVTNISPEHLDYHHTMEKYAAAKALLLQQSAAAVLNADLPLVLSMNSRQLPQLTFGFSEKADVRISNVATTAHGVQFRLEYANNSRSMVIKLPLPGEFNAANAAAATAASLYLGVDEDHIQNGLADIEVAGRWQIIQNKPFTVVVDFAHTPQAFEQVLPMAKQTLKNGARLIHVFGSAAQRDESKRSYMGRLSGQYADFSIITMEDPRHESLDRIQGMIISGLLEAGKKEGADWQRIDDRQKAIDWAISHAKPGDMVLITGKGHEQSLAIKGQELPWSDVKAVNKALGKG